MLPGCMVPSGIPTSPPQLPRTSFHLDTSSQPEKTRSSAGKMPFQWRALALSGQMPSAHPILKVVTHHCRLVLPWSCPYMATCGNYIFLKLPKKVIRYFEYYLWLKPCSLFHLCHDVSFLLNTTPFCFPQANIHLQSLIPIWKSTWTLCNSGLHRRILNSFQSFWSSSLYLHFK